MMARKAMGYKDLMDSVETLQRSMKKPRQHREICDGQSPLTLIKLPAPERNREARTQRFLLEFYKVKSNRRSETKGKPGKKKQTVLQYLSRSPGLASQLFDDFPEIHHAAQSQDEGMECRRARHMSNCKVRPSAFVEGKPHRLHYEPKTKQNPVLQTLHRSPILPTLAACADPDHSSSIAVVRRSPSGTEAYISAFPKPRTQRTKGTGSSRCSPLRRAAISVFDLPMLLARGGGNERKNDG